MLRPRCKPCVQDAKTAFPHIDVNHHTVHSSSWGICTSRSPLAHDDGPELVCGTLGPCPDRSQGKLETGSGTSAEAHSSAGRDVLHLFQRFKAAWRAI